MLVLQNLIFDLLNKWVKFIKFPLFESIVDILSPLPIFDLQVRDLYFNLALNHEIKYISNLSIFYYILSLLHMQQVKRSRKIFQLWLSKIFPFLEKFYLLQLKHQLFKILSCSFLFLNLEDFFNIYILFCLLHHFHYTYS